jgi:subtilisin family serine protease
MILDDDFILFENELKTRRSVKWIERQKRLTRNKRDYISEHKYSKRDLINNMDNDPLWPQMWYLNREITLNLPDMNVTGAWSLGYSGKGVSVTFLDDGLERDHPDLMQNYDPKASYDANNNDLDPMPRYDPTNENKFVN